MESSPLTTRQQIRASLQLPVIQFLLMFLIVLCVYLPTFWYTFVWDDWTAIAENRSIRHWNNIPLFFIDPSTFSHDPEKVLRAEWRPLRNIYYLVTYKIHGLHPAGWHFQHVLLHCLTSAMVLAFFHRLYRFAKAMQPGQNLPLNIQLATWFAVFAWAVHPANTEVTAWLKSADDLLATILTLAALMILFPIARPLTASRAFLGSLIFSAAFLAKESIAPIPAIYPVLYLLLCPNRRAFHSKPFWFAVILLCASLIIYMMLRTALLGQLEQVPYLAGSFSLMMATMATATVRYLQLTFWPFWPTVQIGDYANYALARSWTEPRVIINLSLLLGLFLAVTFNARRSRIFLAGWLWAALAFTPVANIIPMMQVMAERFMYFPLIGIALSLTALYAHWLRPAPAGRLWLPVTIAAALTITTHLRLPAWLDSASFQQTNALAMPENYRASYNYGVTLYDAGNTTEALTYMRRSMEEKPRLEPAMGMAVIYMETGRTTEAIAMLEHAMGVVPDSPHPYSLKGTILRTHGETTMALAMYNEAITRSPGDPMFYYLHAVTHDLNHNTTAALTSVINALALHPQFTSATLLRTQLLRP